MSNLDIEREHERVCHQMHIGYLEQLISDMTHVLYDVLLLSLLAGRTIAPRCLNLLRGKILSAPLGADIAKRLIAMDKLWGRRLLQHGADFEAWTAERERTA
jgi:hypothetical protein